jgi:hypothetical protein
MIKIIDNEKRSTMWFGDLHIGDTFLYNNQLYIKCYAGEAINLSKEAEFEELDVGTLVILVDIEIKVIR